MGDFNMIDWKMYGKLRVISSSIWLNLKAFSEESAKPRANTKTTVTRYGYSICSPELRLLLFLQRLRPCDHTTLLFTIVFDIIRTFINFFINFLWFLAPLLLNSTFYHCFWYHTDFYKLFHQFSVISSPVLLKTHETFF